LENAQGLKDAIDASLDFLRPWMPWAQNEPESLEKKCERILNYRAAFFAKKQLTFGILLRPASQIRRSNRSGEHTRLACGVRRPAESGSEGLSETPALPRPPNRQSIVRAPANHETQTVIGSISINWRVRPDIVDFGYWLRADEARKGYATEAVLGCTFAAFRALSSPSVEIYCNPENVRSAAIPARLRYLPSEPAIRKTADQRDRLSQIWRMDRARFEEIHGATAGYTLYNADGEPLVDSQP
jgi:RimJ/RimL family protein N-acetyltransferase